jgi:hypothetical protein
MSHARVHGMGLLIVSHDAALASHDRDTILKLATRLDQLNNAGCPLN